MRQKVIVVESANVTPTKKLEEELAKYRNDWRIVSAVTVMVPFDPLNAARASELGMIGNNLMPGSASQIYYATTVVIEQVC